MEGTLDLQNTTAVRISLKVRSDVVDHFLEWRGKLDEAIVSAPGFISLEVIPPLPLSGDPWVIIQRFRNHDYLAAWKKSDLHDSLLLEVLPYISEGPLGVREDEIKDYSVNESATEVFVTKVSPKKNQAFRNWEAKIQKAESKFEGYQGVFIQAPSNLYEHGNWITMLRFDNAKNLDKWLNSEERREILKEGEPFFEELQSHKVISPFAGWFGGLAKAGGEPPAVWKETMLILLVLFPIVLLEVKFLMPHITSIGIVLATFVGNAISVSLVSWPMMPLVIYFFGWWLQPDPAKKTLVNIQGAAIVLSLYALVIALFLLFLFPEELPLIPRAISL
jgi:hypothetical protein